MTKGWEIFKVSEALKQMNAEKLHNLNTTIKKRFILK
jgi:hypothetical protein